MCINMFSDFSPQLYILSAIVTEMDIQQLAVVNGRYSFCMMGDGGYGTTEQPEQHPTTL